MAIRGEGGWGGAAAGGGGCVGEIRLIPRHSFAVYICIHTRVCTISVSTLCTIMPDSFFFWKLWIVTQASVVPTKTTVLSELPRFGPLYPNICARKLGGAHRNSTYRHALCRAFHGHGLLVAPWEWASYCEASHAG